MEQDDVRAYWEMMFWRFHGLEEAEAARVLGDALRTRLDATAVRPSSQLQELLARLDDVPEP